MCVCSFLVRAEINPKIINLKQKSECINIKKKKKRKRYETCANSEKYLIHNSWTVQNIPERCICNILCHHLSYVWTEMNFAQSKINNGYSVSVRQLKHVWNTRAAQHMDFITFWSVRFVREYMVGVWSPSAYLWLFSGSSTHRPIHCTL